MATSPASGSVVVPLSALNVLAKSGSAPNSTSRAAGQPPASARSAGNICAAAGEPSRSSDTSTNTRPESASALANKRVSRPGEGSDNSPDTANTDTLVSRLTTSMTRPRCSDDIAQAPQPGASPNPDATNPVSHHAACANMVSTPTHEHPNRPTVTG